MAGVISQQVAEKGLDPQEFFHAKILTNTSNQSTENDEEIITSEKIIKDTEPIPDPRFFSPFSDSATASTGISSTLKQFQSCSLLKPELLTNRLEDSCSKENISSEEEVISQLKQAFTTDSSSFTSQFKYKNDDDLPNTRRNSFSTSAKSVACHIIGDPQVSDTQADIVNLLSNSPPFASRNSSSTSINPFINRPVKDLQFPDTETDLLDISPGISYHTNYVESSQTSSKLKTSLDGIKKCTLPLSAESANHILSISNNNVIEPLKTKLPLNKLSCPERKRMVVSPGRVPTLTTSMKQWVSKTNYLLDPFREDNDCWLHPSPPHSSLSASGIPRPHGKIQKRFTWQDRLGKHSLVLNFGVVSKLINFEMTNQQKDGFINHRWHLSHLCGNWTCLNPAHTTVEPGHVNIGRNNCFSHRSGCFHQPPCMKDKKLSLGADGREIDHNSFSLSKILPRNQDIEYDEWSFQGYSDGDGFMDVNDSEENEDANNELEADLSHAVGFELTPITSQ